MNAEDLRLDELVRFGECVMDLHGRRLIIQDTASLAQFRRDLVEMVGWDDARRILTRKGYFWGQVDAAALKRLFHWDSMEAWLKAGPRLHQILGIATADPISFGLDEASGSFSMEFSCQDSAEVDEYLTELGTADKPCCWVLMGYASGYASYCVGKSVYFVEQECRAKGDERCLAHADAPGEPARRR